MNPRRARSSVVSITTTIPGRAATFTSQFDMENSPQACNHILLKLHKGIM